MAIWQHTLGPRVRDAIAVYYARHPDATPPEIEAWLRDRGFDAAPSDVEDYMAALDQHPDWRTGWINRNIHRYSPTFDPDEFLATRGYVEDDGWVVVEELREELDAAAAEEYEYPEREQDRRGEEDGRQGESAQPPAPILPHALGREDRLPGMALAGLALAASAGVATLTIALLR